MQYECAFNGDKLKEVASEHVGSARSGARRQYVDTGGLQDKSRMFSTMLGMNGSPNGFGIVPNQNVFNLRPMFQYKNF